MTSKRDPYGDEAGTKIGRPSNPDRKAERQADGDSQTGAGQESARGIHGANNKGGDQNRGSEPLKERSQEHVSGYGGTKGNPKRSSDQR